MFIRGECSHGYFTPSHSAFFCLSSSSSHFFSSLFGFPFPSLLSSFYLWFHKISLKQRNKRIHKENKNYHPFFLKYQIGWLDKFSRFLQNILKLDTFLWSLIKFYDFFNLWYLCLQLFNWDSYCVLSIQMWNKSKCLHCKWLCI